MKERVQIVINDLISLRDRIGKPVIYPDYYDSLDSISKSRLARSVVFDNSIEYYSQRLQHRVTTAFRDLSYVFPTIGNSMYEDYHSTLARDVKELQAIISLLQYYNDQLPS